jgi:hypothetical protein
MWHYSQVHHTEFIGDGSENRSPPALLLAMYTYSDWGWEVTVPVPNLLCESYVQVICLMSIQGSTAPDLHMHMVWCFILRFVDRASWYMYVLKPTWCTIYLQFIQSLYTYISCFGLASCPSSGGNQSHLNQASDSQLKHAACTICHIYTLLPPDDGLLASPKHVWV